MKRFILLHYGEVGIKKSHKSFFEQKLRKRLKRVLEKTFSMNFSVKLTLGRFLVGIPDGVGDFDLREALGRVFGIKNFHFCYEGFDELEKLADQIYGQIPERPVSFRMRVKRSQKMSLNSAEIERKLGAMLIERGFDVKVSLKEPAMTIYVEFFNGHGYFSFERHLGRSGLPSNSAGKALSLISAGIDSPVAAFRMMRRGLRMSFIHFHAYPYSDQSELENARELVGILSRYQDDTKFYSVGLGAIQKEIATNLDVPGRYRTILYRRLMLRVAEKLAFKDKLSALVTGDSLGQVASQTLENISVIHQSTRIPLFQPLISYDKEEIIAAAKDVGTYEISIRPCKESCALFAPRQVEVRARLKDLLELEASLPIEEYVNRAFSEIKVEDF